MSCSVEVLIWGTGIHNTSWPKCTCQRFRKAFSQNWYFKSCFSNCPGCEPTSNTKLREQWGPIKASSNECFSSTKKCCNQGQVWASLVAQMLKNFPAMRQAWDRSPGREDTLEKGTATHSSILAGRIPWTAEPGGATAQGIGKNRTRLSN